jgi:hypothetical protein
MPTVPKSSGKYAAQGAPRQRDPTADLRVVARDRDPPLGEVMRRPVLEYDGIEYGGLPAAIWMTDIVL